MDGSTTPTGSNAGFNWNWPGGVPSRPSPCAGGASWWRTYCRGLTGDRSNGRQSRGGQHDGNWPGMCHNLAPYCEKILGLTPPHQPTGPQHSAAASASCSVEWWQQRCEMHQGIPKQGPGYARSPLDVLSGKGSDVPQEPSGGMPDFVNHIFLTVDVCDIVCINLSVQGDGYLTASFGGIGAGFGGGIGYNSAEPDETDPLAIAACIEYGGHLRFDWGKQQLHG